MEKCQEIVFLRDFLQVLLLFYYYVKFPDGTRLAGLLMFNTVLHWNSAPGLGRSYLVVALAWKDLFSTTS